ncbi:hypothetical protein [uncultured Enterovirga sp.]|uniref:hypothetical protein n=1 Tax=uncultured Enterovirga sp. TaxID=2026352 RepID=UPI0035C9567E
MARDRADPGNPAALDEKILEQGRAWFAEIRESHREDDETARRAKASRDAGDGSVLDWSSSGDGGD